MKYQFYHNHSDNPSMQCNRVLQIGHMDAFKHRLQNERVLYQYEDGLSMHEDFYCKDEAVVIFILVRGHRCIEKDPCFLDKVIMWGPAYF